MKTIRYRHTNCFFVESSKGPSLLAVDAGWPCTLNEYRKAMKGVGLDFRNIRFAIVTHFHMDHAGLVGDFIRSGIACYAFNPQMDYIDPMEHLIQRNREYRGYEPIPKERLIQIDPAEFSRRMEAEGIRCEAVATDAHSPDSVTCIVDGTDALIGDLYPIDQIAEDDVTSRANWDLLRKKGVRTAHPSHAGAFELR